MNIMAWSYCVIHAQKCWRSIGKMTKIKIYKWCLRENVLKDQDDGNYVWNREANNKDFVIRDHTDCDKHWKKGLNCKYMLNHLFIATEEEVNEFYHGDNNHYRLPHDSVTVYDNRDNYQNNPSKINMSIIKQIIPQYHYLVKVPITITTTKTYGKA